MEDVLDGVSEVDSSTAFLIFLKKGSISLCVLQVNNMEGNEARSSEPVAQDEDTLTDVVGFTDYEL